jgi:shikimate dehydrogenase
MRQFGLIGRHLSYSFSARYFAEKFASLGIADECSYSLWEIADISELPRLLASQSDVRGFNVTIPDNEQIIPDLDSRSSEAAAIGAVNCVKVLADGSLRGFNTDVDGIRFTLDKLLCGQHISSALILGSGGASKAVRYVLRERGIDAGVVSRTKGSGDLCYDELSPEVIVSNSLIINATPLGTSPAVEQCPDIPYELLTSGHFLFDLVYNPSQTEFMLRGLACGAHVSGGIDMLYAQADSAWSIWNE